MYKFILNYNFLDQFKDTNHQELNKDTDPFKDAVKKIGFQELKIYANNIIVDKCTTVFLKCPKSGSVSKSPGKSAI